MKSEFVLMLKSNGFMCGLSYESVDGKWGSISYLKNDGSYWEWDYSVSELVRVEMVGVKIVDIVGLD
jgi:hypothetical protein